MKILVDADAVPRAIREILIRVAEREKLPCVFVAARMPRLPESACVRGIGAGMRSTAQTTGSSGSWSPATW